MGKGFQKWASNIAIQSFFRSDDMEDQNKRKRGRPRNTEDKAKMAKRKQQEYIAQWERDNYDRIVIRFPKGTKDRITATGESINGYVVRSVLSCLDDQETQQSEIE